MAGSPTWITLAWANGIPISALMVAVQAALSVALIVGMQEGGLPLVYQAAGPAIALTLALGLASVLKARLLGRILEAPVQGWRWPLIWAGTAAGLVGYAFSLLPRSLEWAQLSFGIPATLVAFGIVVWKLGFTHEDRALFRIGPRGEKASLPPPPGVVPPDR